MTINQLIEALQNAPDPEAEVHVWLDEGAEDSATIRDTISDSEGFSILLDMD